WPRARGRRDTRGPASAAARWPHRGCRPCRTDDCSPVAPNLDGHLHRPLGRGIHGIGQEQPDRARDALAEARDVHRGRLHRRPLLDCSAGPFTWTVGGSTTTRPSWTSGGGEPRSCGTTRSARVAAVATATRTQFGETRTTLMPAGACT